MFLTWLVLTVALVIEMRRRDKEQKKNYKLQNENAELRKALEDANKKIEKMEE